MKDLKIFTDNIEEQAREQVELLLSQDVFKDCKVRIMPDVHAGMGCVIGFTANLGDKVIPNIVGVDIGCGMLTLELGKINLDLEKLDNIIRQYIPSGFNTREDILCNCAEIKDLICIEEIKNIDRIEKSIGTLGGGNHFIEVDEDDEGNKYLVIHSGSRNVGNQVAKIYQEKAINYCSFKEEMNFRTEEFIKLAKSQGLESAINEGVLKIKEQYKNLTKLPKELCYLEDDLRKDYLHDMEICQLYAKANRMAMACEIVRRYNEINEEKIGNAPFFETIHNYISFEDNIVRKGAISAKLGEEVLIPINMRDGCIIGIGKGNEDWNQSAPHGAGRIMSRTEAKKTFTMDKFIESMEGIYTTSVSEETLDEAPMVYKPMQEIIENIKDTVDIVKIIKPIYNFKASGD